MVARGFETATIEFVNGDKYYQGSGSGHVQSNGLAV